MKAFSDLNIEQNTKNFIGDHIAMKKILGKKVIIEDYKIVPSKFTDKGNNNRLDLQIKIGEEKHVTWTIAKGLQETIKRIPKDSFPFETTIISQHDHYLFT